MRTLRILLPVALLLFASSCDDSPSGPGSFTVSVEWDAGAAPVGAAVVFLSGVGIGEVAPQGGSLLWSHTSEGATGGMRVVVVNLGTPSALQFTLPVSDLGRGAPTAALLSLAGQDNGVIPISSAYRVTVY